MIIASILSTRLDSPGNFNEEAGAGSSRPAPVAKRSLRLLPEKMEEIAPPAIRGMDLTIVRIMRRTMTVPVSYQVKYLLDKELRPQLRLEQSKTVPTRRQTSRRSRIPQVQLLAIFLVQPLVKIHRRDMECFRLRFSNSNSNYN